MAIPMLYIAYTHQVVQNIILNDKLIFNFLKRGHPTGSCQQGASVMCETYTKQADRLGITVSGCLTTPRRLMNLNLLVRSTNRESPLILLRYSFQMPVNSLNISRGYQNVTHSLDNIRGATEKHRTSILFHYESE